jgi:hypothetical protein
MTGGPRSPTNTNWFCLADDTRKPINSDPALNKRCVQRCAFHSKDSDNMDRDLDCDPGTICVGATADNGDPGDHLGFCMEGVMPPQACVNAPQRFEVRASEAFTVIGSRSGYIHPFIENPDKSDPNKLHACVVDPRLLPSQRQVQVGRFSLKTPPDCGDPMNTDPITGESPPGSGKFEPNPCSPLMPVQFENLRSFPDGNCDRPVVNFGQRSPPEIKFRNRGLTLTLVDPYYPGDRTCPLDRLGSLNPMISGDKIPLVFPGYQISFHQTSGYSPMTLPIIAPAFPIKVIEGPTNSIWVLDDGDTVPTTLGAPATRGQVYRIESIGLSKINLLQ